jgi:prepilin-type N-terminal cleavage/methylation domain-containing protein
MNRATRRGGFTLVEMALVLAILGALALTTLGPLGMHLENRARRATAQALDTAVEALYGFALLHGRLPCPDLAPDGDGREDRRGDTACMSDDGYLPDVDLGIEGRDAWRRRLRYHLTAALDPDAGGPNFAAHDDGRCRADDADLDLCEQGVIEIVTRGDDPRSTTVETKALFTLANGVPAVVVSHGANGEGVADPSRDEAENADRDHRFVARDYAAGGAGCRDDGDEALPLCHFDDSLRWVSPTVLANRLVRAGRLP